MKRRRASLAGDRFFIKCDTIRFGEGDSEFSGESDGGGDKWELTHHLAVMGKICSMDRNQRIPLKSKNFICDKTNHSGNAWCTVSISPEYTEVIICRVKCNGVSVVVSHYPVTLRDVDASYAFCIRRYSGDWNIQSPFLVTSLTGEGKRVITRGPRGGVGYSNYSDPLTDFVLERTRQFNELEIGVSQDPPVVIRSVNLIYVKCTDTGDECLITVSFQSVRTRRVFEDANAWLDLTGPCLTSTVGCDLWNSTSDSGWFNSSWKDGIRSILREWIVPDLAGIISDYGGHHTVPILPQGIMAQRCRDFYRFCEGKRLQMQHPWYEWTLVATDLEASCPTDSAWLDAFSPDTPADRVWFLSFGDQILSLPVTQSMAIATRLIPRYLRDSESMKRLLGTAVDTRGERVDFNSDVAVFGSLDACMEHMNPNNPLHIGWLSADPRFET